MMIPVSTPPAAPDSGGEQAQLAPAAKSAAEVSQPKTGIWQWQGLAKKTYEDIRVQIVVAALIGLNFFTNIVTKEIDPQGIEYSMVWEKFELFYNIVFTIELLLNMYGSWCRAFWESGWNVFDFVVVMISLLDTFKIALPEPLKMLRMMRAFRVFRLFKRVKSLNKIVVSLVHAIPGVMNAFFINMLFMCIYAVLAVDLFGYAENIKKACDEEIDVGQTLRSRCWGEEYFGTFGRSLYTLFQVLTCESWSEMVVRPLFAIHRDLPIDQFFSGIFFVSFIMVNGIVLINVVVAVLLDKMAAAKDEDGDGIPDEEEDQMAAQEEKDKKVIARKEEIDNLGNEIKLLSESSCQEMKAMRSQIDGLNTKVLIAMDKLKNLATTR